MKKKKRLKLKKIRAQFQKGCEPTPGELHRAKTFHLKSPFFSAPLEAPCTRLSCSRQRDAFLTTIGYPTYEDYLWSPLWLGIRSMVFERSYRRCEDCGRKATQVHHHVYSEENLRGRSLLGLVAVCWSCHEKRHGLR